MTSVRKLETVTSSDHDLVRGPELGVVVSADVLARHRAARALKLATQATIEIAPSGPEDPCGYYEIYTEAMKAGATVIELDIDGSEVGQLDPMPTPYGLSSPYILQ